VPSITGDITALHGAYRTGKRDGQTEAMQIAFNVFDALLKHNTTADGIRRGYQAARTMWLEEQARREPDSEFARELRQSIEAAEFGSFPEAAA
jgi:hypothetical protein